MSLFDKQMNSKSSRAELHLSGLILTDSHPDKQKIRIIGFFLKKIGYISSLQLGSYCLQYVPASKPFDHS